MEKACRDGDLASVQRHVEQRGPSVLRERIDGQLPIHVAARYGHAEIVRYVLAKDPMLSTTLAEIDRTGVFKTPMHVACDAGHLEVVRVLVSYPQMQDSSGSHAVHHACRSNKTEIAVVLIDAALHQCAWYDAEGLTPVHLAASSDSVDILEHVHARFPDALRVRSVVRSRTIAHLAAETDAVDVFRFVLRRLPDLVVHEDFMMRLPFHLASKFDSTRVMRELLTWYGEGLYLPLDLDMQSPMHHAAQWGAVDVIRMISRIVSPHHALTGDKSTWTPLHHAVHGSFHETTRALLEWNAGAVDVEDEYGRKPLEIACYKNDATIVAMLLNAGADPRQITNEGSTALHLAAYNGNVEVVDALLTRDPTLGNERDAWGKTPYQTTLALGHSGGVMAVTFVKHGCVDWNLVPCNVPGIVKHVIDSDDDDVRRRAMRHAPMAERETLRASLCALHRRVPRDVAHVIVKLT